MNINVINIVVPLKHLFIFILLSLYENADTEQTVCCGLKSKITLVFNKCITVAAEWTSLSVAGPNGFESTFQL